MKQNVMVPTETLDQWGKVNEAFARVGIRDRANVKRIQLLPGEGTYLTKLRDDQDAFQYALVVVGPSSQMAEQYREQLQRKFTPGHFSVIVDETENHTVDKIVDAVTSWKEPPGRRAPQKLGEEVDQLVETRHDMGALQTLYRVHDTEAVHTYLRQHPFLFDLLRDARQKIADSFGSQAIATLDVVTDPEDDSQLLFALISGEGDRRQNFAQRRAFDQVWWFNNAARAQGKLCIDIE